MGSEHEFIESYLLPEFIGLMQQWAKEYKQPRRLGVRGEFVGLSRKTDKIKTAIWDGEDTSGWRESPRTILFEIACHAFLMIYDLDHGERCGRDCAEGHTYMAGCKGDGDA